MIDLTCVLDSWRAKGTGQGRRGDALNSSEAVPDEDNGEPEPVPEQNGPGIRGSTRNESRRNEPGNDPAAGHIIIYSPAQSQLVANADMHLMAIHALCSGWTNSS